MGSVVKRLSERVQLQPLDLPQLVGIVPTGAVWIIKSLYVRNTRTDGKTVTYHLYKNHGVDGTLAATWSSPLVPQLLEYGRVISPGELQVYEFGLMALNAGDSIQGIAHEATAVSVELHGVEIT